MLGIEEHSVVVLGVGVLADLRNPHVVLLAIDLGIEHGVQVMLLFIVLVSVEGLRQIVAPARLP